MRVPPTCKFMHQKILILLFPIQIEATLHLPETSLLISCKGPLLSCCILASNLGAMVKHDVGSLDGMYP